MSLHLRKAQPADASTAGDIYRPRPHASRDAPLGGARICRNPTRAGGVSQPLARTLSQTRISTARAARLHTRSCHRQGLAGIFRAAGAVAETNDDLKALIGSAESFIGPGFLVPTRNAALLRWCLGEGLRITQTMTLMAIGLYNQPEGAWLPSVIY